jgi:hypothetical protein
MITDKATVTPHRLSTGQLQQQRKFQMILNTFFAGPVSEARAEVHNSPRNISLWIEQTQTPGVPAVCYELTLDQARSLQRQIHIHLSALDGEDE